MSSSKSQVPLRNRAFFSQLVRRFGDGGTELKDDTTAVRVLCRDFILRECPTDTLESIHNEAAGLYEDETRRYDHALQQARGAVTFSREDCESAIQVLQQVKAIFKAFERREFLQRLSTEGSKQVPEVMCWGILQGIESLLCSYQLLRAAWRMWQSESEVAARLGHVVDLGMVPWTEDDDESFREIFSHAEEHVKECVGEERCVYELLRHAKAEDLVRGQVDVLTFLLLPYTIYRSQRPVDMLSAEEIATEQAVKAVREGEPDLEYYLRGAGQPEEQFDNVLFSLRSLALYACLEAHSHSDNMSVQKLQRDVVEPFCQLAGYPKDNALALMAVWRTDCGIRDYKKGLDKELLSPGMRAHANPVLYRKVLWSLARQRLFHKLCHLLDAQPPTDFNLYDGVLRVGALLAVNQWQRAFFERRNLFPRGGGDGDGVLGSERLPPLPLWTLVDYMLGNNQIHDLLSLPFNQEEEQDVLSYLSKLQEGHVLILLLLRRRLIERAVAVHQLHEKEFPPEQPLTKDLVRILRNYEPFLPDEEIKALKGIEGSEDGAVQLCRLVAHLDAPARPQADTRAASHRKSEQRSTPSSNFSNPAAKKRTQWPPQMPPAPYSAAAGATPLVDGPAGRSQLRRQSSSPTRRSSWGRSPTISFRT